MISIEQIPEELLLFREEYEEREICPCCEENYIDDDIGICCEECFEESLEAYREWLEDDEEDE